MKRFLSLFLIVFLLAACGDNQEKANSAENDSSDNSNEESQSTDSNLVNTEEVVEGKWIGQSGAISNGDDMVLTEPIHYDSSKTYTMNKTSYVTYLKDDEVIESLLYSEGAPEITLESVEEANKIRISMKKNKLIDFVLTEE
ncbi:membrane lipoprotein lipid attachment site-containing protein [Salinicoccus halodurans]|uniref:Lipocalin-like domain-containing protein n=1 Tax=Salinicoccus halodurans TaxID=407035 RepID=A0A0F7HIS5_9STAP|nr:membrane lipoprotein lipid attachment site-containing protein [Salinicoccus halodurans]AKG73427.1 hypothetical protein AAT16_03855 [Salinicoccus halodurans]SFK50341.1 hypothetical protein SAMN05216235_0006 [Salinicoccus halodurans]